MSCGYNVSFRLETLVKSITISLSLLMMLLCGCGSSSKGDNLLSISGTVSQKSFEAKSGAFDLKGDSTLFLAFTDLADICGMAERGETPSDFRELAVSLCIEAGSEVGEYQITSGNPYVPCEGKIAWAEMRQLTGGVPNVVEAEGNIVKVNFYSSTSISGRVGVAFADGGMVAGDFEVEYCDAIDK
jgi:hypothetical protein